MFYRTIALGLVASAAAQEWTKIEPEAGSATGCGKGGDYSFWWRAPANGIKKVVIEFESGGACWNTFTCLLPIWLSSADRSAPRNVGMRNTNSAVNHLADWGYLYLPYCTGDVHVGGGKTAHGVFFNGRANARAALDFLYRVMPTVDETLVTGESAGSLGASAWAPYIAAHYRDAERHVFFGDSYAGVASESMWPSVTDDWELLEMLYPLPGLDPRQFQRFYVGVYQNIVEVTAEGFSEQNPAFPTIEILQYSTNQDGIQIAFTTLANGPFADWSRVMRSNFEQHATTQRNSGYYINSGSQHGIITGDGYYDAVADGVNLASWVRDTTQGRPRRQVVDCCSIRRPSNLTATAASKSGARPPVNSTDGLVVTHQLRLNALAAWLSRDTTAATAYRNTTTGATNWEVPQEWYATIKSAAAAATTDAASTGAKGSNAPGRGPTPASGLSEGKVLCAAAFSSRYQVAAADQQPHTAAGPFDPQHVREALAAFRCDADITPMAV